MTTHDTSKQFFQVKNWDKFQQYKDRDPKWIKLYRDVLDDYEFEALTEVQQIHLVKIWLFAAKVGNKMPFDPAWIGRKIGAKSKVDLEQLVTSGFICLYKSVQNCTELYTEEEREGEKEEEKEQDLGQQADPFDLFWDAYPRKVKKQDARKAWKSRKLDRLVDDIIEDVTTRRQTDRQWKEGYIPHPTTYLRGSRWQDEIEVAESAVDRATREALEWRDNHGSF